MNPIRTMLVDDEEPARDRLRSLLADFDGFEIVAEAADGQEALERIGDLAPDLVFLDIEMPGLNGLQVVSWLRPPRPHIVFCTAYDAYAVEAFEQHASDYLLKPVARVRLSKALDRVRASIGDSQGLLREVADARRAQARLLPCCPPTMRSIDYHGICRPARGIGGDYYDFLALDPQTLGLALGDVSGKGIFAALLMASLQARVQSLAPRHGSRLDRLIAEINRELHASIDPNRYATLFFGRFDDVTRRLDYVNAGHPAPLVVRDGATERLAATGTVVGSLPDATWAHGSIALLPGDVVCAFSDGVVEARSASGEEFGEARLVAALRSCSGAPAASIVAGVIVELDTFVAGAEAHDDLTLLVGCVR